MNTKTNVARHFSAAAIAGAACLAASPASAQVDFSQVSATEIATLAEVQTIAGATDSAGLDGVGLGPSGDLLVLHLDTLNNETVIRLDPTNATGSLIGAEADFDADLGAPYNANPWIGEGGFNTNAAADTLYFGDSGTGDFAIVGVDLVSAGFPAAEILRGNADLDDTSDFALLPTGEIVVARGAAASASSTPPTSRPPSS